MTEISSNSDNNKVNGNDNNDTMTMMMIEYQPQKKKKKEVHLMLSVVSAVKTLWSLYIHCNLLQYYFGADARQQSQKRILQVTAFCC